MDIFYYWKKFEENIKDDMVGRFVSQKKYFEKLKGRNPDYIWTFIIPKGCGEKGNRKLKLLARLKWSDTPLPGLKPTKVEDVESEIYYDYEHTDSILYSDTDSDEAINLVTGLLRPKYAKAFEANFQGSNGVHVMESYFACEFNKAVAHYSSSQLLTGIAKLK